MWRPQWTTPSHAASAGRFSERCSLRFWSVGLVAASSKEQLVGLLLVVPCEVRKLSRSYPLHILLLHSEWFRVWAERKISWFAYSEWFFPDFVLIWVFRNRKSGCDCEIFVSFDRCGELEPNFEWKKWTRVLFENRNWSMPPWPWMDGFASNVPFFISLLGSRR